ncbi:hypothetical protein CcaverHIS631_0404920 [Cutaneotrichosporon cavernicola]|nr:hypothetical protein CcaverHIS631_0404920 [Cutaneotrichosporon cavernicola]
MAGSPPSPHLRMRPSIEFAEPRTTGVYVTPRRPHTEFGVPGATSTPSSGGSSRSGSEPRPILRHQSSNVRISSPLRKQVGFDDKPRIRPVLKSNFSAGSVNSASTVVQDTISPRLRVRERRGRAHAQVSWAQTIAVPPTSNDFMEELTPTRSGRSVPSNDGHSDMSRRSTSIDSERPVLRAARSISFRARPGNRPASAASSTSTGPAGLWYDVPVPPPPHPSTCMPGFPQQEFPDARPPKFSRELLRRPGVIMPKAAPRSVTMPKEATRPASIATEYAAHPLRQPSTSRMSGFLSRKLSKISLAAHHEPPAPPVPVPMPQGPVSQSMSITPVGQHPSPIRATPHRSPTSLPPGQHPSPVRAAPHRSPTSLPPGFGSPQGPRVSPQHLQWPSQSTPARYRGAALPPGAAHLLPPGAGPTLPSHMPNAIPTHMPNDLPPGAMAARPMTHGMPLPVQPTHVLSPQEAARQALRRFRSSPALRVTSPLEGVPEDLPTQWVERIPPPPVSPLGGPQGYDDELVVRAPNFAHPPIQDAPKQTTVARPPHLSIDFGSGDIWADLESSFGVLSLPDLPADAESPDSPGSNDSHTTTATATTRATHATYVVPEYDEYSEVGHSQVREAASDADHAAPIRRTVSSGLGYTATVRRGTSSDVGHSTARVTAIQHHRDVFSETGHGGFERMYSPPSSPVRAKAAQRAASESECTIESWSPKHKLSASAPGTPVFGSVGRLPPRGESLVASSLGATSNRPMFTPLMLNTPPVRTSSRSPSSLSLRSSTSMASESTISSLPSTMTSMTTASSAASVEMPDPIAEDESDTCLDVFGIMPKGFERDPCRQVQFSTPDSVAPDSVERVQIRHVQRARSSVATLRVRSIA